MRIPARFNGPPGSANGGFACGLVAGQLDVTSAEVSLRAPPPLERELSVERVGDAVRVSDGETLVAEGRAADVDVGPLPEPPSHAEASQAVQDGIERWTANHPFPTCFVCGAERQDGDGLEIFPVEVGDGGHYAAPWTPEQPGMVWAALDCPTSAPGANWGEGPPIVLARLAVAIDAEPELGEPHVIVSWPLGRDGRKREAAAALFDEAGGVLARSRALWIELRQATPSPGGRPAG